MKPLDRSAGWLGRPPGTTWPERDHPNPFVRYRELLWSYHAALEAGWDDARYVEEVQRLDAAVTEVDGTGFVVTPYRAEAELSEAVGLTVSVKDETGNVSGSHKARHMFGLALHLAAEAAADVEPTELAISSCGNAALGAATVARAADRSLRVFIPTWADPAVVAQLERLDATIEICPRRQGEEGDPTFLRFSEAVAAGARPFGAQAAVEPLAIDGAKTLGFELASAFAEQGVPDNLLVQVGGGGLASSTLQGLFDGHDLGVIDTVPRFCAVQTEGCAPLARAHRVMLDRGGDDAAIAEAIESPGDFMWPWDDPSSAATGILDDITYDWLPLSWGMLATGGSAIVAHENDVDRANLLAHEHTDVPVDHTGTAGLAGLLRAVEDGLMSPDSSAAVLFTGHIRS